jgi:hypothetical protein
MRNLVISIFVIALIAGGASGAGAAPLDKAQIEQLTPAQFAALPAEEVATLVQDSGPLLTAAQIQALPPQDFGFLISHPTFFPTLCKIGNQTVCVLTPQQLSALPTYVLTALHFTMLSAAQVAALSPAAFAVIQIASAGDNPLMTNAEVAVVTPAEAAAMPTAEFDHMSKAPAYPGLLAAVTALRLNPATLTAAQIAAWTPETIAAVGAFLPQFTPTQVRALNLAALTLTEIPKVLNIFAMTSGQLAVLSPAQVGALTVEQLLGFPVPLANAFSPAQLAALDKKQLAALATDKAH